MQGVDARDLHRDAPVGLPFLCHPRLGALLDRGALLCAGAFILNILWNGASTISALVPGELQRRAALAASPWSTGGPQGYQQESPFFYLLAHVVRADSAARFLALCIAVLLAAYILVYLFAWRSMGKRLATLFFLLLLAHPITYVAQTWLGMVDCVTILCTVVLMFATNGAALLAASTIGTFNHPAMLFIAPSVLVVRMLIEPGSLRGGAATAGLIGIAVGGALSIGVLRIAGIAPASRWSFVAATPMRLWVAINLRYLPLALYSFAFALWVPLAIALRYDGPGNPRLYRFYAICGVIFYGVVFFCRDTTRVFALFSWGPTLLVLMHVVRSSMEEETYHARLLQASVLGAAFFGWLAPHLFIWDGGLHSPGFLTLWQFVADAVLYR
jgi:hypothetical protein